MSDLPFGQVVAGEYEGKSITTKGFIKQMPVLITKTFSKDGRIFINNDTVKDYELMDEGTTTRKAGRAVGGAMLFGTTGAIIGSAAAKSKTEKVRIAINWKDGNRSLVECNGEMKRILEQALFK